MTKKLAKRNPRNEHAQATIHQLVTGVCWKRKNKKLQVQQQAEGAKKTCGAFGFSQKPQLQNGTLMLLTQFMKTAKAKQEQS